MRVPSTLLLLLFLPAAGVAQQPTPRPAPPPEPRAVITKPPRPPRDVTPLLEPSWPELGPIHFPPVDVPLIDFPPIDISHIDVPPIAFHAMELALAELGAARFQLEDAKLDLARLRLDLPMDLDRPMHLDAPMLPEGPVHVDPPVHIEVPAFPHIPREPLTTRPRPAWAPQDAADSLYRVAREALNRSEYRRAAQTFRQLRERYPRSEYAGDAVYWEAFALYRIGTIDDLRNALRVLESHQQARFSKEELQADAPALAARIRGALAVRGDREAAQAIQRTAAGNGQPCDQEDISVRVEALSALSQMDGESVVPILRRVLARRDECSAQLRRRALSILGRRGDTAAVTTFLSVAKSDPDPGVRAEAIGYLARQPGDRVVDALEDLLRTSTDERVQRSAVRALAQHESPRARRSLRALIERPDVREELRREAIGSFERERTSADDAAYIRSLYGRLESQRLKESVIHAAARLGGADNEQWLANLVKNPNESSQLRAAALGRLGRTTVPVAEFIKMYDAATERGIREQIMNVFAYRKEPEATDKLIEIARTGTDPVLRRLAINYLSRKNDPRTQRLLLEILDK
ncbi:MAG: HEAT repeat domain-containing protein [Gemmatimonadaceae bacterium]